MGSNGQFDIDPRTSGGGTFGVDEDGRFMICGECCGGPPCPICPDGALPSTIQVDVAGITPCAVMCREASGHSFRATILTDVNGSYTLPQDGGWPCYYDAYRAVLQYYKLEFWFNPTCTDPQHWQSPSLWDLSVVAEFFMGEDYGLNPGLKLGVALVGGDCPFAGVIDITNAPGPCHGTHVVSNQNPSCFERATNVWFDPSGYRSSATGGTATVTIA